MIDSSAMIAILTNEPERPAMIRAILVMRTRLIGAPTLLETSIVFDNRETMHIMAKLNQIVRRLVLEVVSFDAHLSAIARFAHREYGKGTGHPARLNFGDRMAYALAKQTGEPLLFKGRDLIHTDLTPALS